MKRLTFSLAAVTLSISMLAGCGSGNSGAAQPNHQDQKQAQTEKTQKKEAPKLAADEATAVKLADVFFNGGTDRKSYIKDHMNKYMGALYAASKTKKSNQVTDLHFVAKATYTADDGSGDKGKVYKLAGQNQKDHSIEIIIMKVDKEFALIARSDRDQQQDGFDFDKMNQALFQ